MIDSAKGRENAATGYTSAIATCSLHTADPGTTRQNEVAGGAPAYAPQPVAWAAGVEDGYVVSEQMEFDIPTDTTLAYFAVWDAAGNYLDKGVVAASFVSQGILRFTIDYTQA